MLLSSAPRVLDHEADDRDKEIHAFPLLACTSRAVRAYWCMRKKIHENKPILLWRSKHNCNVKSTANVIVKTIDAERMLLGRTDGFPDVREI